ncbi:MAG: hypothetical protein H6Q00_404 [Holophagaceae bacterium]|nr:hypothetical protein [Holophagaceae bacterium]
MAAFAIRVPIEFDLQPFAGRWFSWSEIEACFWPGPRGRSEKVNSELAPARDRGGVYLMAWSEAAPEEVSPIAKAVKYIGQTNCFKARMGQFASSAGLWGPRADGHSAGWRWPEGKSENLFVAFFPINEGMDTHLANGLLHWLEAVGMDMYKQHHARLPSLNARDNIDSLSM